MASKGAFYKQVDQDFYAQVKKENGGKLPADLVDANGNPRKLTTSAADRGYRQKWLTIAAKGRKSKAVVSKDVDSPCVPCAIKGSAAKIPPILLPSKAMGKPAKLKTVTPSEPPPPKKTEPSDEPCKHDTLTVECSDEDRGFKLQLPPAEGSEEATTQFEVIDNGKEKVTCSTKIVAGPCGASHKGKVFDIYPADSVVSQSDEELVFRANYLPDLTSAAFSDLFPPTKKRSPQTFGINVNTCQQDTLSATVAVYPQVDWNLDISLAYKSADDGSIEFDFKGDVGVTVQGVKKSFGVEIKNELESALKFAQVAAHAADWISSLSKNLGNVKVTFDGPALAFSGTWGWREIEKSASCGYGYNWSLGFSPLIAAKVTVDILGVLIDLVPAIGQIVNRVRSLVSKDVKLEVDLSLEGTLSGTFQADKNVGEPVDCSGDLSGELELTLEGVIGLEEQHFLCFHASVEAKVGGHASLTADIKAGADGDGAYYEGDLKFDGLKIYAVVDGGIGVTNGDPPPDDDGPTDGDDDGPVHGGIEYTLVPEKTLLDSGKQYFLGEEDGD